MTPNKNDAIHLLRVGAADANAIFRDGQWPAIEHVASGRGKLLVVQRTGWGMAAIFLPAFHRMDGGRV